MEFVKYPKISSLHELILTRYRHDQRTHLNEWYVSEMLDGQHLALYADAKRDIYKAACRKRFLETTESYGLWKETLKKEKYWLKELSHNLMTPIITYGKILGGKYNKDTLGTPIRTVCQYSILNEYFIHDIRLPMGFLSMQELNELGAKLALNIAPVLYKGKFAVATCYPENKLSTVPFMNDLKPIYNNEMKGIVIRPNYDLHVPPANTERMIVKKLNRRYIGKDLKEEPVNSLLIESTAIAMENEASTRHLLDLALASMGAFDEYDVPKLVGKYVTCILDSVNNFNYGLLNKKEKHLVRKQLNTIVTIKINKLIMPEKAA